MRAHGPRVPNDALIPIANRVSQCEIARRIAPYYGDEQYARRVVNRVLQPGTRLALHLADRICCALGYHPVEVFGRDLWEAGLEDETWEDITDVVELERMAGAPEYGPERRMRDDLKGATALLDEGLRT